MRLRTKFAVVFVVVTLVLSGSVFAAVDLYRQDAIEESRVNVDETATLTAKQIDASIRERQDYLGLVASRPGARQFEQSGPFLDALLSNSRFYAAQIVAANGTVVAFRGDVTARQRRAVLGSNRSAAPYVRAALDGRSFVGEGEAVDDADRHVLVFSTPIFEGGEVTGVLAGAIYLDSQTVFDALPPLETSSQTVRVVGNGMELHEGDRQFAASIEASATVDATGWTVTVVRDRSALDARLRRLGLFQIGQLGIVFLLMAGFGYWQYAASLRQTERLLGGFVDLGDGDYDRTVSLSGGTEWEQISDGFNDLAATLHAREAALRRRTQRLEVMYRVLRHNLRNQLTVLLTYADVIADLSDDDEIRRAARSIGDAGRTLTHLSERARQIETALADDQTPSRIDVSDIVSDVVADLRETYPAMEIETSLPDGICVRALPSLRTAIESVCENACQHNDAETPHVEVAVSAVDGTDGSGTSTEGATRSDPVDHGVQRASQGSGEAVETARDDGVADSTRDSDSDHWVRVTVVDNGPGLPEQDRTAITEGRETELEHASGLGLWLAHWVVDRSGGHLRFHDASPRGTVVELLLPEAAAGTGTPGSDGDPEGAR
jgi:signal transduction histidine kinase